MHARWNSEREAEEKRVRRSEREAEEKRVRRRGRRRDEDRAVDQKELE